MLGVPRAHAGSRRGLPRSHGPSRELLADAGLTLGERAGPVLGPTCRFRRVQPLRTPAPPASPADACSTSQPPAGALIDQPGTPGECSVAGRCAISEFSAG